MVPVKPTDEMVEAGFQVADITMEHDSELGSTAFLNNLDEIFKAMLAAVPVPPDGYAPCSPSLLDSGVDCATAPRWSSPTWDGHSHWHPVPPAGDVEVQRYHTSRLRWQGGEIVCSVDAPVEVVFASDYEAEVTRLIDDRDRLKADFKAKYQDHKRELQKAWDQRDALQSELTKARELLNTPHTDDWFEGVRLEAGHQIGRWGTEHDAGKSPADWFWLIGYLAQKAMTAQMAGNEEKARHHTISTGAALLNWFRAIVGDSNVMRPGIDAAHNADESCGQDAEATKGGAMIDQSEKLSADCHAAICDLQNLRQHLVDLRAKQWPAKDWDVSGQYVSANIGHAAKVAAWDLPKVDAAIRALSEYWAMLESDTPAEDVRAVVEEPAYYRVEIPRVTVAGEVTEWFPATWWLSPEDFKALKPPYRIVEQIYSHPQRPVVLPERRPDVNQSFEGTDAEWYGNIEWNACLDAVEELNK